MEITAGIAEEALRQRISLIRRGVTEIITKNLDGSITYTLELDKELAEIGLVISWKFERKEDFSIQYLKTLELNILSKTS